MFKEALCFDDVQLLDGYSTVESRSNVDLSIQMPFNRRMKVPILAAAMNTVASPELGAVLLSYGAGQVFHRYCSVEDRIAYCEETVELSQRERHGVNGCAIGITETERDVELLITQGWADLICIDVAACFHESVFKQIEKVGPVCREFGAALMVGNFSNELFLRYLDKHPARDYVDYIKVSQGGGSVCTTRIKTGIGKPTFQAVHDLYQIMPNMSKRYGIAADGGVRNSGDIVKAVGAGASMVMLGSVFAGHDECPGTSFMENGRWYKEFSGMASAKAKATNFQEIKNVEGVTTAVPHKGSIRETIEDLIQCVQSGIATAGFDSLEEFIGQGEFIRVTSSGAHEAAPHSAGKLVFQHQVRG
jgi:IMP dehydrogenase